MSKVEILTVNDFSKDAYLDYSMAVVKGRAIPDVRDGMKPVQRRILFAMSKLRLFPSARHVKSARVVGDVIGQYHPHGDTSVYDAMVRMAQPFSLRYPLVDGQGNFGSREGDPAAAMRYTESKMTPLAEALIEELNQDTVDFSPNFDGTLQEPVSLPSRLPILLMNGTKGVAVGLATEFPPHHLGEIAAASRMVLLDDKVSDEELLNHIQGPDFPTGSTLISSREEILKIYREGRGSFRLRAKWRVEPDGKDGKKWKLVFYQIPQETNVEKVHMEIERLLDPKPGEKDGKKLQLTPEQLRLKKMFSELVASVDNHSDRNEKVRLTIVPADKKIDPDTLALTLCAHTSLESNYPANLVAVDDKGTPRQGGLTEWIRQWCYYRILTVRRRLMDEKRAVDHKLHLYKGRLSLLDRIQEVVKMLTESDNPKQDLMDKYGLDEIQAEDILEMRLRQLARMERYKLEDEIKKLTAEQTRLDKLLKNDKLLRQLVVQELDNDVKKFNDERRTEVKPEESSSAKKIMDTAVVEKLGPEPVGIVITERGWLAWKPVKSLEEAEQADYKIKAGDNVKQVFFADRNQDYVWAMDDSGRAYSLKLTELPSKSDTMPFTQWFDISGKIIAGGVGNNETRWMVAGQNGCGFIAKGADIFNRMKAGKAFLTLDKDELPLTPLACPNEFTDNQAIISITTDGRVVAFPAKEMKVLPKGKGVALLGLVGEAKLYSYKVVSLEDDVSFKTKGGKIITSKPNDWKTVLGPRSAGKKGKSLFKDPEGATFN